VAGVLGKVVRALAVLAVVIYMLYSCAVDAGVTVQRKTTFATCEEADGAAAASQRLGLQAERDQDWEQLDNELLYQSRVIFENAECFPSNVVIDAKTRLLEAAD
jgi:hypothetical protein